MTHVKYSQKMAMTIASNYLFIIGFFILFLLVGVSFHPVFAQNNSNWSPQQRIPGYENETWPPILIADRNRTVHAFSSQWLSGDRDSAIRVIMYNQWSIDRGWTKPVDILKSPLKNDAQLLDAFLDLSGMVHVIYFGGDDTEANIYYSRAPINEAGNAHAWSLPAIIVAKALAPGDAAFFAEDSQHFGILLSGKEDGNGLYAIYSGDSGYTWSDPELIYPTNNNQLYPYNIKVYLGQLGILHAAWSIWDQSGNGLSVHYANYDLTQKQWSDSVKLTSEGSSGFSDVIEYDGRVIVTYSDYSSNAFWMRYSSDRGRTWTEPMRIAPHHIGRNGETSLVIDSSNTLHFFFAERITGNPDIHGMWHSVWQNDHWTSPEPIVSGPRVEDKVGDHGFDPLEAQTAVSQGNLIIVTWRTENQSKGNGVWYSYKKVDAPELQIETLPSPPIRDNVTPIPTTYSPTATHTPQFEPLSDLIDNSSTTPENNTSVIISSNPPLGLGLIFLVILISATMVYIIYHRRRR